MAKIVLEVGEHPEETPMTRLRATQLKKILSARPYGHEVQVVSASPRHSAQELYRKFLEARTKGAAFKVFDEFWKDWNEHPLDYASDARLIDLAKSHRDSHVFSLHATPIERADSPDSAASFKMEGDHGAETAFWLSSQGKHSSVVFHFGIGGRVAGLVESVAKRAPHSTPYKANEREAELRTYLKDWIAANARSLGASGIIFVEKHFERLWKRARGVSYPPLAREAHARALAKQIHSLVAAAERGGKK